MISINPSFFFYLLVNVVRTYGKDKFYEKIKFESEGEYDINNSLTETIDRILNDGSSLEK